MMRSPKAIVPPLVTLGIVIVLLGIARFYDRLPLHPPACSFRVVFGIPCVGCGGTRAFMKLAHGDIMGAFAMNPLSTSLAFAAVIWVLTLLFRKEGKERKPVKTSYWVVGTILVLGANWIYLLLYLPR